MIRKSLQQGIGGMAICADSEQTLQGQYHLGVNCLPRTVCKE